MKRLASLLILIVAFASSAVAQFIGYAAQQTVTKSVAMGANPLGLPTTSFPLPNFGQAGHTIRYNWTGADNACNVWLEGSTDNTVWAILAAGPNFAVGLGKGSAYAQGYFPYLRLTVNPDAVATCTAAFNATYVGYQTPLAPSTVSVSFPQAAVKAVAQVITAQIAPGPALITGMQCFNSNGVDAFLQIFFSAAATPTLGTNPNYQVGIGTKQTFVYNGPPIVTGDTILWSGASTAVNGNVGVAVGLTCDFQINYRGPFYPSDGLFPD
jgi:hypothetical protein